MILDQWENGGFLVISAWTVIKCILCAGAVMGFWILLRWIRGRERKKLGGGFSDYIGIYLSESELLQVVVLEEMARRSRAGFALVAKKTRRNRAILTGSYILVNFVLIMTRYYKSGVLGWSLVLALLYVYLRHRMDPVREVCAAVKAQPDRDISEIVSEMTSDQPRRSWKPVGIIAFALSLGMFFWCSAESRYSFAPVDGGYSVEKYRPGITAGAWVRIPETHSGEPVVAIGKHAFEEVRILEKVMIPDTVIWIDSYAFRNCANLWSAELPSGLLTLNGESFKGCAKLREIAIPEGVREIRGNTFEGCERLSTVVLHDGIVDIHAYAFKDCSSLRQITLPSGITDIHAYTFENCTSLQEIRIPSGVTRIGAHAFYNCNALQYVFVPDTVKEIRSSAFRLCAQLKEIELPKGVTVNERAFKESPTKIKEKRYTDEETERILAEAREKDSEVLYYVFRKESPESVYTSSSRTVQIADDPLFSGMIGDSLELGAMHNYAEVLKYLETAKQAGVTKVEYYIYSPLASEISGEDSFVINEMAVDEMIEVCREYLAEDENG